MNSVIAQSMLVQVLHELFQQQQQESLTPIFLWVAMDSQQFTHVISIS